MESIKNKLISAIDFFENEPPRIENVFDSSFSNSDRIDNHFRNIISDIDFYFLVDENITELDLYKNEFKKVVLNFINIYNEYEDDIEKILLIIELSLRNWKYCFEWLSDKISKKFFKDNDYYFLRSLVNEEINPYKLQDSLIAITLNDSDRNIFNLGTNLCTNSCNEYKKLGFFYFRKFEKKIFDSLYITIAFIRHLKMLSIYQKTYSVNSSPNVNVVDRLIEKFPNYLPAYKYGCLLLFENRKYSEAIEYAKTAIQRYPSAHFFKKYLCIFNLVKNDNSTLLALKQIFEYEKEVPEDKEIRHIKNECYKILKK